MGRRKANAVALLGALDGELGRPHRRFCDDSPPPAPPAMPAELVSAAVEHGGNDRLIV